MIFHQPGNSGGIYNYNAYIYQNTTYESHFHRNFELIYVLSGELSATVSGYPLTLFQGDALLIAPDAVHSFSVSGSNRIWVGVFSRDFVPAHAQKNDKTTFSPYKCDEDIDAFLNTHLFVEATPDLYTLIACLYLACAQCLKNARPLAVRTDVNMTERILRYASEHFADDISMRSMADALQYEYHYFSKVFHDCFGMNFKDFIHIYRVETASRLLAETQLSLTRIAMESGFQSIRTFNRVFKSFSGMTPSDYRNAKGNATKTAVGD